MDRQYVAEDQASWSFEAALAPSEPLSRADQWARIAKHFESLRTAASDPMYPRGTMPIGQQGGLSGRMLIGHLPGEVHSWATDYDALDAMAERSGKDADDLEYHHDPMADYLARRGHEWASTARPAYIDRTGRVEFFGKIAQPEWEGMAQLVKQHNPNLTPVEPVEFEDRSWDFNARVAAPEGYFDPAQFPNYHENPQFGYDRYEPGRPGKGMILPDGTAATWNVGGYGTPDDTFFAGAGPHHAEVAQYIGLDRYPETSEQFRQEDREESEAEGLPYEEPEPSWHSPISIDSDGNYKFLHWNDNHRKDLDHPAYMEAGLRHLGEGDEWHFGRSLDNPLEIEQLDSVDAVRPEHHFIVTHDGRVLAGPGHHHEIIEATGIGPDEIKAMGGKAPDGSEWWLNDAEQDMRKGWAFSSASLEDDGQHYQDEHEPQTHEGGQPLHGGVYYHVAPRDARHDIAKSGLTPSYMENGQAVYLHDDLNEALNYSWPGTDLWEVTTTPTGRSEGYPVVHGTIPPTALRLMREARRKLATSLRPPTHFDHWGKPCSCTFVTPLLSEPDAVQFSNDTAALAKVAGKLHDFLMNPKSRPDLQTPEGQRWLQLLEYHQGRMGDKFDPLTPWLTREWKKGRISHSEGGAYGHMYLRLPNGDGSFRREPVRDDELSHWADFYRSNHPLKRDMGDIMQHDVHALRARVQAWSDHMRQLAHDEALAKGQIVHQLPNGWTIQNLTTPEELEAEGNAMGHCVGGYDHHVASGHSIIHSLRDPEGKPHATIEIAPTQHQEPEPGHFLEHAFAHDPVVRHAPDDLKQQLRDYHDYEEAKQFGNHDAWLPLSDELADTQGLYNTLKSKYRDEGRIALPEGGEVVQVQGKGNNTPIPEYQDMIKHYFTHHYNDETRPGWQDQNEIDHIADLDPDAYDDRAYGGMDMGHNGDYGLEDKRPVDWHGLVKSMVNEGRMGGYREPTYDPAHGKLAYELALKRKAMPEFAKAVEDNAQKWQENFDDWRDMNREHWVPYPDEEEFSDPDEYNDAMERYEQDEANWADEHPGMKAAEHLYSLINPHYQFSDTSAGGYVNEPQRPTTFSRVANNIKVIEHKIEPDLWDYSKRRPVLWHPHIPDEIHVGPTNVSHPELFHQAYSGHDDYGYDALDMTDDRTGTDYAAGWVGANPENQLGMHPDSGKYGWYGELPPREVNDALRNHFGLPDHDWEDDGWHFGRLAASDPLAHMFWEELTPRAQEVVKDNAERIYDELERYGPWGPTNCDLACEAWSGAFQRAGVPVQEMHGNYYPQSAEEAGLMAYPTSTDHSWLLVDGKLFDPTASQFATEPIKAENYRTSSAGARRAARSEDYHGIDITPYADEDEGGILEPWEPGHAGKAYVNEHGQVRHWRIDPDFEAPHHSDVMTALGEETGGHTYTYIQPDGKIEGWGATDPQRANVYQQIADHIGGYVEPKGGWNFSHLAWQSWQDPEVKWEKAILMDDGTEHRWPTNGEDGAPTHAQWMVHNNIDPTRVKEYREYPERSGKLYRDWNQDEMMDVFDANNEHPQWQWSFTSGGQEPAVHTAARQMMRDIEVAGMDLVPTASWDAGKQDSHHYVTPTVKPVHRTPKMPYEVDTPLLPQSPMSTANPGSDSPLDPPQAGVPSRAGAKQELASFLASYQAAHNPMDSAPEQDHSHQLIAANPCPECGAREYEYNEGEDRDGRVTRYWHCNACGHHEPDTGLKLLTKVRALAHSNSISKHQHTRWLPQSPLGVKHAALGGVAQQELGVNNRPSAKEFLACDSIREAFQIPEYELQGKISNNPWRVVAVGTQGDPHEERASGHPVIVDPTTHKIYVGSQGHYHFALQDALGPGVGGEQIDVNSSSGQIYFGWEGTGHAPTIAPVDQQRITQALSEHFGAPLSQNADDWHFGAADEKWYVEDADVRPEDSYLADSANFYTHSPWVADPQKQTIYIGPVGTHHADLMKRYYPNKWMATVPWGTINNGMIHGGQNVTPAMGEAIRNHTGLDLGDGFESNDDWHFGSGVPSEPLAEVPGPEGAEVVTPPGFMPFRPDEMGKAFKRDGVWYAWSTGKDNSNFQGTHHEDAADAMGFFFKPSEVRPYGRYDDYDYWHPDHGWRRNQPEGDWHFGSESQGTPEPQGPLGTGTGNNLLWNPPNTGKGFVAGDKLYTWNVSGNKPHHHDMWTHFRKSEPDIPIMSAAFAIDNQGNVSKEYGDPADFVGQLDQDPRLHYEDAEQWRFAATQPITVYRTDEPGEAAEDMSDERFNQRRPIIYNHDDRILYVGGPGMYHSDLVNEFDVPGDEDGYGTAAIENYRGMWAPKRVEGWTEKPGTVKWFGEEPEGQQDEIHRLLNAERENPNEWHFGGLDPKWDWSRGLAYNGKLLRWTGDISHEQMAERYRWPIEETHPIVFDHSDMTADTLGPVPEWVEQKIAKQGFTLRKKDDWHFGAQDWHIIHGTTHPEDTLHDDGEEYDHWPLVVSPEERKVWMGVPGTHHVDLASEFGVDPDSYDSENDIAYHRCLIYPAGGKLMYDGPKDPDLIRQLEQHVGEEIHPEGGDFYFGKVAANQGFWHVAPVQERNQIRMFGLKPGTFPNVYVWNNPETAQVYQNRMNQYGQHDIWHVNPGVPVVENRGEMALTDAIPPHNLRLQDAA